MQPSFPKLLFPLLFLLSIANASMEETCKIVAATRPDIGFEFCIKSLQSDPSTIKSDPTQLAIIATKLSITNATRIVSKITSLMQTSESDPSFKDCLSVCSEVYLDAIDHLNDAVRNLKLRSYQEAITFLSAALDASDDCEDAFNDQKEKSPMEKEDKDYGRLADIALTITASLGG